MTKLSDIQLVLLSSAAQRPDGSILPPPASIGGHAARIGRTIAALIKRELASEAEVSEPARTWREDGERRLGAFITDAGRGAIGAEDAPVEPSAPEQPALGQSAPEQVAVQIVAAAKPGSKTEQVLLLLRREQGATLEELVHATGWLPHTTRAALTGLRHKGHVLDKGKRDEATCYTIQAAA